MVAPQMMRTGLMSSAKAAGGGANPTLTPLGRQTSGGTSETTKTFTGLTLHGSTGATHLVGLAIVNGPVVNSATLDGETCTIVTQSAGNNINSAWLTAPTTANATGTLVVNFANGALETLADVYVAENASSFTAGATVNSTALTSMDLSATVAANDAIAAVGINVNGSVQSWGGDLTEVFNGDIRSTEWTITGYENGLTAGTKSITTTWTTSAAASGCSVVVS